LTVTFPVAEIIAALPISEATAETGQIRSMTHAKLFRI